MAWNDNGRHSITAVVSLSSILSFLVYLFVCFAPEQRRLVFKAREPCLTREDKCRAIGGDEIPIYPNPDLSTSMHASTVAAPFGEKSFQAGRLPRLGAVLRSGEIA
jgi:hypothetical protein